MTYEYDQKADGFSVQLSRDEMEAMQAMLEFACVPGDDGEHASEFASMLSVCSLALSLHPAQ